MEVLGFQDSEPVLHDRVIQAIAFSGHALDYTAFLQCLLIKPHLVLPTLIGVQYGLVFCPEALQSAFEHIHHHMDMRSIRYLIGDDLLVIEIQYWGEVHLLALDVELGDVGNPLLIGPARHKVAIELIGGGFAD